MTLITDPKKLLEEAKRLQNNQNSIFRGQPDAQYSLLPSAFRPAILKENAEKFPVSAEEIEDWYRNPRIKKCIQLSTPHLVSGDTYHFAIRFFLDLYIHIMRYNFQLFHFFNNNLQTTSHIEKNKLLIRNPEYWRNSETFFNIVENLYPRCLKYEDRNGGLLLDARPDEDLAGIDETFPQHYDVPTAALDWSYNPFIAIFFGIKNNFGTRDANTGLYLGQKTPAPYFSLFMYKQIISDNSKVLIMPKSEFINNPRAIAQEGTFTYFQNPCTFYLENGRFPSIEDYVEKFKKGVVHNTFEITKYSILNTQKNIDFLRNELEKLNIIETSLLLCSDHKDSVIINK